MGCDIHMHIEVRTPDGRWHHYAAPDVRRDYLFFALMGPCGRCEEVLPVAPSRGLPDDASEVTRLC